MFSNLFKKKQVDSSEAIVNSSEVWEQIQSLLQRELDKEGDSSFEWIHGYRKTPKIFELWLISLESNIKKALDADTVEQQIDNIFKLHFTSLKGHGIVFGTYKVDGTKVGLDPLEDMATAEIMKIIAMMWFEDKPPFPVALSAFCLDVSIISSHAAFSYKKDKPDGALNISPPLQSLTKAIIQFPITNEIKLKDFSLDDIQKICKDCYLVDESALVNDLSDAQIDKISHLINENITSNYIDVLISRDGESLTRYFLVLTAVILAYFKTPSGARYMFKEIFDNVFVLGSLQDQDYDLWDKMQWIGLTLLDESLFKIAWLISRTYQFQPAYKDIRDATYCLARFALVNNFGKLNNLLPDQGKFHSEFFSMLTLFSSREVSYHRDIQLALLK